MIKYKKFEFNYYYYIIYKYEKYFEYEKNK